MASDGADTCAVVLNDRSFGLAASGGGDGGLLESFGGTLRALKRLMTDHEQHLLVFVVPSSPAALALPSGTRLYVAVVGVQDPELRLLLRGYITDAETFDEWAPPHRGCRFDGAAAPGRGEALRRGGLSVSLDLPQWRHVRLPVRTDEGDDAVTNVWTGELQAAHWPALEARLPLLPELIDPGAHDSHSREFVKTKSIIPRHPDRLLRRAVPEAGRTTWWALCEHGFYHRFQGAHSAHRWQVHWNGTTNPRATQPSREEIVPVELRRRLQALTPTRGCGCREVL